MADETASLIIAVNSTSAVAATANLDALSAAGARAETSSAALAATIARQNAAMGLGNTEAERAAQVLGRTATATSTMAVEAEKASVAIGKVGISSSVATREILVLGREAARGNWTRMAGSATILSQALGFAFTGPVLAAAAAIGFLAFAEVKAALEVERLNQAIGKTGNYANVSVAEIQRLETQYKSAGQSITTVKQAFEAVTASGRFNRDELALVAKGVADTASVTGQSVASVVKDFEKLKDEPVKAMAELQKSTHAFTQAQIELVKSLDSGGQSYEAGQTAIRDYAATMGSRTTEVEDNAGLLAKAAHNVAANWNAAWAAIARVGQPANADNTYANALRPMQDANAALKTLLAERNDHVNGLTQQGSAEFFNQKIIAQSAELKRLAGVAQAAGAAVYQQEAPERAKAAADAQAEASTRAIDAVTKENVQFDRKIERTQAINQLQSKYLDLLNSTTAASRNYAASLGVTKDAHGLPTGGAYAVDLAGVEKRFKDPGAGRGGSHSRAPVDKEVTAYNSINKSIQEHIALLSEAADGTAKLDENQKFAAKILEDLDLKTNKLNARDKERIRLALQTMLALDQEAEASKRTVKLKEEEARADDSVLKFQNRLAEHMASELSAIVNSNDAKKKEQDLLKVTLYYQQMRADVELRFAGISKEATAARLEELSKLDAAEKASTATVVAGYDQQARARASWQVGAANALAKFQEESSNVAGMVETAMTGAFQGAQDALLQFVNTGKLNFKAFAVSIIQDIEKIIIKLMVMRAVEAAMNMMGMGGGGAAIDANSASSLAAFAAAPGSANGNAFSAGNIIPYANGGVVSSPTLFPMANGMGLMGEAGPEAVMPLKRGSNGKLGVVATGSGAGVGDVNITVMVDNGGNAKSKTSGADQAQGRAFAKLIESKVQEGIMQARRPGGQLWQMANGQ